MIDLYIRMYTPKSSTIERQPTRKPGGARNTPGATPKGLASMCPKPTKAETSCLQCGQSFVTTDTRIAAGRGKYCSKACMYAAQRVRIPRACEHCNKTFYLRQSDINGKAARFCSPECSAASRSKRSERQCLHCGSAFLATRAALQRGWGKFCSKACYDAYRAKVERVCEECGASFWTFPSKVKAGEGRFCSRSCTGRFYVRQRIGPNSPTWQGGRSVEATGYVNLTIPGRGSIREHRYVMEQHLGRELRPDEHVHHINGDRSDNRIENLQIMSQSEHMRLHAAMRRLNDQDHS